MQARHVEHQQVRALAGLERSDQVIHVQGGSAEPGGHGQRLARGNGGGIAVGALGEQRRQPRLLEHVEVVVRRRPVGADADVDAELQHPRDRCDAGRQLQVAGGIVGDAGIEVLERANLAVVHVNAVRGQDLRTEQAVLANVGDARHAVAIAQLLNFEQRLGEMDVQGDVEFGRQLRARSQDLRRARIGRVGRRRGHDERMALPALDELARAGEAFLVAPRVR